MTNSNDKRIRRADDVAAWRLCMGCGACRWACPHGAVSLVDRLNEGIRPVVDESLCEGCGRCVEVCPGVQLRHQAPPAGILEDLFAPWGPVLETHRAYATDGTVRFAGSSGGVATALALYVLEELGWAGVLHTRADETDPLRCVPVFSRSRAEILAACGSRYAPAAPCQGFDRIKQAAGPCLFIGKPCDVAALRMAQAMDPELDANVGLAVSIFCAGTPAGSGTRAILEALEVDPGQVTAFRYRGQGWPGHATAVLHDGSEQRMSYEDSWGRILSKHVTLRCRLCPDGTGEFADISCGDLWAERHRDDQGLSNVLLRTERGRDFWRQPRRSAYVTSEPCDPGLVTASQPSLLRKKSQLAGRLRAIAWAGAPRPVYEGFRLSELYRRLPWTKRLRVVLGTLRRVIQRKWYRRQGDA